MRSPHLISLDEVEGLILYVECPGESLVLLDADQRQVASVASSFRFRVTFLEMLAAMVGQPIDYKYGGPLPSGPG